MEQLTGESTKLAAACAAAVLALASNEENKDYFRTAGLFQALVKALRNQAIQEPLLRSLAMLATNNGFGLNCTTRAEYSTEIMPEHLLIQKLFHFWQR